MNLQSLDILNMGICYWQPLSDKALWHDSTPGVTEKASYHFRKHSTCSLIFANQKKIPYCRQCHYNISILSCYTHACKHNKKCKPLNTTTCILQCQYSTPKSLSFQQQWSPPIISFSQLPAPYSKGCSSYHPWTNTDSMPRHFARHGTQQHNQFWPSATSGVDILALCRWQGF